MLSIQGEDPDYSGYVINSGTGLFLGWDVSRVSETCSESHFILFPGSTTERARGRPTVHLEIRHRLGCEHNRVRIGLAFEFGPVS